MGSPDVVDVGGVILGCGTFGGVGSPAELIGKGLDRDAALATLDEAVGCGITVLDTAASYAGGASERVIGEWLASRPTEVTSGVRIATKVLPPSEAGEPGMLDTERIAGTLAGSCERLGVPQVALLLTHAPDPSTPIEITIEALATLRDRGTRWIGACNVDADVLLAGLDAAARLGVPGYDVVQNGYSLMVPDADRDVRRICREHGIAYTAFSPLAGGVLTGKYARDEPPPAGTRLDLRPEGADELLTPAVHDAIDRLRHAAADLGTSCAGLALAWLLAHDEVAAPVVGPSRRAPHLSAVSDAVGVTLDADLHAEMAEWFRTATGCTRPTGPARSTPLAGKVTASGRVGQPGPQLPWPS